MVGHPDQQRACDSAWCDPVEGVQPLCGVHPVGDHILEDGEALDVAGLPWVRRSAGGVVGRLG